MIADPRGSPSLCRGNSSDVTDHTPTEAGLLLAELRIVAGSRPAHPIHPLLHCRCGPRMSSNHQERTLLPYVYPPYVCALYIFYTSTKQDCFSFPKSRAKVDE